MPTPSTYMSSGDFIIRSPILSVNNILNLPTDLSSFFLKKLEDDLFVNNLVLASPPFFEVVSNWRRGLIKKEQEEKVMLTLLKYWLRMSTRCTPYGGFAGTALGKVTTCTNIQYKSADKHRYYSRLDMNFISELVETLNKDVRVKNLLRYYPNNTLYKIANNYRFVDFETTNGHRSYQIIEIPSTAHIDSILEKAAAGLSYQQLNKGLIDLGVEEADATDFVDEIIDSKILVSDLQPTVTGDEYLFLLASKLKSMFGQNELVSALDHITALFAKGKLLNVSQHQQTIVNAKHILPSFTGKDLVQTDLHLALEEQTISNEVIQEIIKSVTKVYRIAAKNTNATAMDEFITKFSERFEDSEINLGVALDTETGIGYADFTNMSTDQPSLLQGMQIMRKSASQNMIQTSNFKDFQQKKLYEALRENLAEIIISEEEMDELTKVVNLETHYSMYIMGILLGGSSEKIDALDYQFALQSCGGPFSGLYMGRFCHGDQDLCNRVIEYVAQEEAYDPDCVFAEIVHQPHARTGNVIMRPIFRKYEIPYLSNSSVEKEYQLPVSDLFLRMHNGKLILSSKSLHKKVIPRLTNAHNPASSTLPVYRFLADYQFYGYATRFWWDWEEFYFFPYLPRVRYGKIILAPAQWVLRRTDHSVVKDLRNEDLETYFKQLFEKLTMPRYVLLMEGDNQLTLDLRSKHCVLILREKLLKLGLITLRELLAHPDNCFVVNQTGEKFTNEIIIPINKKGKNLQTGDVLPLADDHGVQRNFTPGSRWLYAKLYCGTKSAQVILKEFIAELTRNLIRGELIDQWFFIRYADPDHHIRIRFYTTNPDKDMPEILRRFQQGCEPYIENGLIHKVQFDTYKRELERYGPQTMEISERIFHYDSTAVLDVIRIMDEYDYPNLYWLISFRAIDIFLNDAGYDLSRKLDLINSLSNSFSKEIVLTEQAKRQLSDKYRKHNSLIAEILNPECDEKAEIEDIINVFAQRSAHYVPLFKRIKELINDDPNELDNLMKSYIHMFTNRFFESKQRTQEWMTYDFLSRYYRSRLAKNNL